MLEHGEALTELFAVRYEAFVARRGWKSLERPDRLDIDEFDDDYTVYFVQRVEDKIAGGARLRPTVLRHMLKDTFSNLCSAGAPPVGPHVYECSRTFLTIGGRTGRRIFAQLLLEIAEYCLKNEISLLTGVLEPWWLNSYLRLGLEAIPLGPIQEHDGLELLAVSFPINHGVRDNLMQSRELRAMDTARLI